MKIKIFSYLLALLSASLLFSCSSPSSTFVSTPAIKSTPKSNSPNIKSQTISNWYAGGTLHKAKVKEWRQAPYTNRLATSADFLVSYKNLEGIPVKGMDGEKPEIIELEKCISATVEDRTLDNEDVAFISAMCTVFVNQ